MSVVYVNKNVHSFAVTCTNVSLFICQQKYFDSSRAIVTTTDRSSAFLYLPSQSDRAHCIKGIEVFLPFWEKGTSQHFL